MNKNRDPKEIAEAMIKRSICMISVGACIATKDSVHSWGHNHVGFDGRGEHAEASAIRRSNKKRIIGQTIYVAGEYRNANFVNAKPCEECQKLIDKFNLKVVWRNKRGEWNV